MFEFSIFDIAFFAADNPHNTGCGGTYKSCYNTACGKSTNTSGGCTNVKGMCSQSKNELNCLS